MPYQIDSLKKLLAEDEFARMVNCAIRIDVKKRATVQKVDERVVARNKTDNLDTAISDLSRAKPSSQDFPIKFGNYRLLSQIGQGGMGRVFLAEQSGAERKVALKIIRPDLIDQWHSATSKIIRRFQNESRTTANIDHSNIVTIYDVGEIEGRPFYSMQFVDGQSLNEIVRDELFSNRRAAQVIASIADALHLTHSRNILHRDIKPSNIMLDADDHPFLMDFGLAKSSFEASQHMTQSGTMLGTIAYMSPEQSANPTDVAAASDIYSLGGAMYYALTGKPPFDGKTTIETIRMLRDQEPIPLRTRNPKVAKDLETICLKCLEKSPANRYSSARELADDLNRFLEHQPILAKRANVLEKSWKWTRRNRAVASLIAAMIFMAAFGIYWFSKQAKEARASQLRDMASNLLAVKADELSPLIANLNSYGSFDESIFPTPPDDNSKFRINLALLKTQPSRIEEIAKSLPDLQPAEIKAVADSIRDMNLSDSEQDDLIQALLESSPRDRNPALQLSGLIANLKEHPFLQTGGRNTARRLSEIPIYELNDWVELLRPTKEILGPNLRTVLEKANSDSRNEVCVAALSDLYQDDIEELVHLISIVPTPNLSNLWPRLKVFEKEANSELATIIETQENSENLNDGFNNQQTILNQQLASIELGGGEAAWSVAGDSLAPHKSIPLIQSIAAARISPDRIIEQIEMENDADTIYAAILALGEYDFEFLKDRSDFLKFQKELTAIESTHSDSGVHSAASWLLDKWQLDSGQIEEFDANEDLEWFNTSSGIQMVKISAPERFICNWKISNSGPTKAHEFQLEPFAIGAKEVTRKEFARFMPNYDHVLQPENEDLPANNVSLNTAAIFCNKLSKHAGLSENDFCYEIADGKAVAFPDFRKRKGFRLPLETEWEYACAAGSKEKTFYGHSYQYANLFGWNVTNSNLELHPAGKRWPNRFGLFDTFGNVQEWTHRVMEIHPEQIECLKGHPYTVHPINFFRGERVVVTPDWKLPTFGFRIAQSIPE